MHADRVSHCEIAVKRKDKRDCDRVRLRVSWFNHLFPHVFRKQSWAKAHLAIFAHTPDVTNLSLPFQLALVKRRIQDGFVEAPFPSIGEAFVLLFRCGSRMACEWILLH